MHDEGDAHLGTRLDELANGRTHAVERLAPVLAAVDRHDCVHVPHPLGGRHLVGDAPNSIDDGVAGDDYRLGVDILGQEPVDSGLRRREMHGAERADDLAIALLGKGSAQVAGAQAGLDMSDR